MRVRILVVDDNRDAADSLRVALELYGYAVEVSYDAEAAISMFASHAPDVAFLDVGMPGMSGLDLARLVRRSGCSTYLVAVTGWGQPQDVRDCISAGFDEHLTKPAKVEEVVEIIRQRAQAAAGADENHR